MACPKWLIGLFFLAFVFVAVVVPSIVLGEQDGLRAMTPPTGNELEEPLQNRILGSRDNFTQRLCPNFGADLPAFATDERLLSNAIFKQTSPVPDPRGLNAFAWGFGQFIDHDIVLSENDETQGSSTIEMLPATGTFITLFRVDVRDGPKGKETWNGLSGAIDASTVYGDYKSPQKLAPLRTLDGTGCKMITGPKGTPKFEDGHFHCGDVRCEEHMLLSSLHSLFLREHNRWCDFFDTRSVYRDWTKEQRFWKARSLTIAVIQHITYEEWLPALFGSQRFLLTSTPIKGESTRISTEFGVSAFRFGHSMVADTLGDLQLQNMFFNPVQTIVVGPDSILQKALGQHAETVDNKVVDGLRDFLFTTESYQVSEDLLTRNLFRAREIGLPSYEAICHCFGTIPLGSRPGGPTDPMVGFLSEPLIEGSSLPHTIAVIMAEQFQRLRRNDPNFYTNPEVGLSGEEMYFIRSSSLRSVLLRNTKLESSVVPRNAFFKE